MDAKLEMPLGDDDILRAARPRLVAFSGRAGSGKSVAANALIASGFKRVKFADGLKTMLAALYGVAGLTEESIQERIEGELKEDPDPILCGASPRHAMQTLGGDWGRDLISPALWVSIWNQAAIHAMTNGYNVVVDDVRYVNEVAAIHKLGGQVVQIVRPASMTLHSEMAAHASERFEFEPDQKVINDRGVIDLHKRIVSAYA